MIPEGELSSSPVVAGFTFPVKTLHPDDRLQDWEYGGTGINNPDDGLLVKLWHFTLSIDPLSGVGDVYAEAPDVPKTLLFSGADISEISGCFDQNMHPFIAYIQAGQPKIWWYDTIELEQIHTDLPAGAFDLRCSLDDKRDLAVSESDIILSYIRDGDLYACYQRERYLIENLLAPNVGRLVSMAMNKGCRMQWRAHGENGNGYTDPYLGDVVNDFCREGGLLPHQIDVSDLYDAETDLVPGIRVINDEGLDKPIDALREMYPFDKSQHGGKLHFPKRGQGVVARIPYNHLRDSRPQALKQKRKDSEKLPKLININHIDPTGGFAKNKQTASRRTNLVLSKEKKTIDAQVVQTPDQAASAALRRLKVYHNEIYQYEFTTTIRYAELVAADVIEVEDENGVWHRMRITERNEDRDLIKWEADQDAGSLAYKTSQSGSGLRPPVSTTPGLVGDTQLEILNLPVQRDQDDELGLYIAARGASSGWRGYALYFSVDMGLTYSEAYIAETPSNIGETLTDVTDLSGSVEVLVPYPLESVSAAQIAAGYNRAVIGDEEIQYQTATLLGMFEGQYRYNLTGLVRGVLRTNNEPWSAGIRFVAIDESVLFVQIQREFYGMDLYYKAVSIGQSIDEVDPIAFLFNYAASQTEWAGTDVEVAAADGGGVKVTWVGAPRLGTFGPSPFHSKYMVGYQVKFSDGHIIETTEQEVVYPAGLLGTEVEVRAINAITGLGPMFGGEGAVDPGDTPVFGFSGSFPDLYEGEPVYLIPGDNDIDMAGGYWDANARGFVVPGVGAMCYGAQLSNTVFTGIPFAAGSYTSMVRVDASSPEPGGSGMADINQPVTVLPRPSHGLLDLRLRDVLPYLTRLLPSSPPWKKWEISGGSMHFYGVNSGLVAGQVIITGATGDSVALGINGSRSAPAFGNSPIGIGMFDPSTKLVGDGTYSVELNAGTGDFWIYEDVSGTPTLIHSGNQPLTPGCLYHIGLSNTIPQTFTAEFNGGNEAWFMAVTQPGHGGIPVPVRDTPLAWGYVEPDYNLSFGGNQFVGATVANDTAGGPSNVAKSNAVYTTGRWRWKVESAVTNGICVAAFDETHGELGSPGSPNSVGVYGTTLSWSWGGGGSLVLTPLNATYMTPVLALDADGDTLGIYYQDHYGVPTLAHTLPLPAGQAWHVAARVGLGAAIVPVTGPAGYADAIIP